MIVNKKRLKILALNILIRQPLTIVFCIVSGCRSKILKANILVKEEIRTFLVLNKICFS